MEVVNAYLTLIDAMNTLIAMIEVTNMIVHVSQHHAVQMVKLCAQNVVTLLLLYSI